MVLLMQVVRSSCTATSVPPSLLGPPPTVQLRRVAGDEVPNSLRHVLNLRLRRLGLAVCGVVSNVLPGDDLLVVGVRVSALGLQIIVETAGSFRLAARRGSDT